MSTFVDVEDQLVNIAQIIRRCPTITLARAFTKSYRDWAAQTQYLRVSIPGITEADVSLYSLGSDPYMDIIGIDGMQGSILNGSIMQFWPIAPVDSTLWSPNQGPNQPMRYDYVPEGQFALNPTPGIVYNLLVGAIVQPKEGATQLLDTGIIKWRTGIESGALSYLHSLPGQPWTNPAESARHARIFQSSISNARAAVQRGNNTGSVRVRPARFLRR